MPTPNTISAAQLSRLIGLPDAPVIVKGRIEDDHALDPRMLPGSVRKHLKAASTWSTEFSGRRVIIVCQRGEKLSQGAAAWLRHEGVQAESLEGGFEAWVATGSLLVRPEMVPPLDDKGRTVWVTRARPKVDRIACPWLIRRLVDPASVFVFVAPSEIEAVADRFGNTPVRRGRRLLEPSRRALHLRRDGRGVRAAHSRARQARPARARGRHLPA